MATYAPPPAETYSDSDSDEFGYTAPTSLPVSIESENYSQTGGFNWGTASNATRNSSGKTWAVGNGSSRRSPPKSKIPVASPSSNGVNIEDFRLAIIRGNLASAELCVRQGVDVNVTFKTGWTPLMYSAHQANQQLVTLLLDSGANPNLAQKAPGSITGLMTCCTSNVNKEEQLASCVNLLIAHGADVNAVDKNSMTALMMACKKGHFEAAKVLTEAGSDVNMQDVRGYSPLCCACSAANLRCIQLLVEGGADILVRTVEGQSALSLAQSSPSYPQISEYFASLPGFVKDEIEAEYAPPPTNLSNGRTEPQLSLTPEPAMPRDQDIVDTAYNKFGDLEVFLYGLDLSSLIPQFQKHSITLGHLLIITDDELVKIGVESVGHRKRILDSTHELHKKDWQPSSIPCYESVKVGKQLSCPEVTAIIANVANHSACITASLKYVTSQVQRNPSLLQVDKHGRGLHALRRFLHELNGNSESQAEACKVLRTEIEKTLGGCAAETADHITRETTSKSGNRLVIYTSALVTLAVVSLGVYVVSKKFPHVRIPWLSR